MSDYNEFNTAELPKQRDEFVKVPLDEYNKMMEIMEKMYEKLEEVNNFKKHDSGKLEKFMNAIGM